MGKWKLAISRRETLLCERNLRCRKSSLGQSRESSLVLIRNFLQKWPRVEFHHFGPYSVGRCSTYGSSLPSKLEPSHNDIMEMAGISLGLLQHLQQKWAQAEFRVLGSSLVGPCSTAKRPVPAKPVPIESVRRAQAAEPIANLIARV